MRSYGDVRVMRIQRIACFLAKACQADPGPRGAAVYFRTKSTRVRQNLVHSSLGSALYMLCDLGKPFSLSDPLFLHLEMMISISKNKMS